MAAVKLGIRVLAFDLFGTVVDWRGGVVAELDAIARDRELMVNPKELTVDAGALADAWRRRVRELLDRVAQRKMRYRVLDDMAALRLKDRGIRYYRRAHTYQGLSIPGAIKLGKCYFVHGISHSRHAAATHLARFGANVVFGHVHRSQRVIERTVTSDGFGAWCPGTLAKLQPLYAHTSPTSWSHGYAVQFVMPSSRFLHVDVPIHAGASMLSILARAA